MKKRIAIVLGMFLLAGAARFGRAQEPETENRVLEAEGTITSADWVGDRIVLDAGDAPLELVVADDVKVMKGTELMNPSDLEQGAHIKATYTVLPDGTSKALDIFITDPL
jgi:hypothetical protein